ncbi:hypothetical protein ACVWYQ_003601 [Bradyrhizobium sp. USDA 3397]
MHLPKNASVVPFRTSWDNDAGRDGAFVGRWDGDDPGAGASTIQCKFTSKPSNLSLSILTEELEKTRKLAKRRLAADYIILTNHAVSGASELKIKEAFERQGVGRCRVFGYEWIVRHVRSSPRLRMVFVRHVVLVQCIAILVEQGPVAPRRESIKVLGESQLFGSNSFSRDLPGKGMGRPPCAVAPNRAMLSATISAACTPGLENACSCCFGTRSPHRRNPAS